MTIYWHYVDIPELHSVPIAQRRRLWSEAVTRSFSVRYFLACLAVSALGAVAFIGLGYLWSPKVWVCALFGLVGVFCIQMIFELSLAQPRARRWLRQHVSELDRY